MGSSGGDGGASRQEKQRQSRINTGMGDIDKAFSGFDQGFYDQRAQDYTNYANPQVMSDYRNTKNQLAYSLARNGLSRSSADINQNAKLSNTLSQNLSDVANEGQNQANTLRTNVANEKANSVNQLISSAEPSVANESALSSVAGLQATPAFAPVGNLFQNFSNQYLANQTAKAYSNTQSSNPFSQLFAQ